MPDMIAVEREQVEYRVSDHPAPERSAILIVGPPRSHGALLAQTLSLLGASASDDAEAIAQFEEETIEMLGATTDAPWIVEGRSAAESREAVTQWLTGNRAAAAAMLLRRVFPDTSAIVLHTDHLTALAPMWRAAIERIGATARIVAIVRDPQVVTTSPTGRVASRATVVRRWQHRTLTALRSASLVQVVDADAFVRDPGGALETLAPLLSLDWSDDHRARAGEMVASEGTPIETVDPLLAEDAPVPTLVRETWSVCQRWNDMPAAERDAALASLDAQFDDALQFVEPETVVIPKSTNLRGRPLILHYHLFKNAGSSVDEMLRRNFGPEWMEQEFPLDATRANVAAVEDWVRAHPEKSVLSSHTALLPRPRVEGVDVFPIIFVRHPLLRLKSAYSFERRQQVDNFGANLAKREDFAGYVDVLLDTSESRQARNFQTMRFAHGSNEPYVSELERAMIALRELPFVGLVEAYDASLERLQALLRPTFPQFTAISVRKNVTDPHPPRPIAAQVEAIRTELGSELFDRVAAANEDDMVLFDTVRQRYDIS